MRYLSIAAISAAFFMASAPAFADSDAADLAPHPLLVKEAQDGDAVGTFALKDFPWNLPEGETKNVSVPLGEAFLTMPTMTVKKDGDSSVTLSAPELVVSKDSGLSVDGGMMASDVTILIERRDDTMVADGTFAMIEFGDGDAGEAKGQFQGLEFTFIASDYELTLAAMEADEKAGSKAMREAMGALDFSLDYAVKSTAVVIESNEATDAGPSVDLVLTTGPSDTSILFGDGRLGLSAKGLDSALSVSAPMPIQAAIGLMSYSFSMPIEASPDPQNMTVAVEIDDVTVSDLVWNMIDPQQVFPRSVERLQTEIDFNVILNESMFDAAGRESRTRSGGRAMDPVDVSLSALEFKGLGLDVSGKGDVAMDGELLKDVSAFLSIAGLSEFMINAVKAGFLQQPQAIMAEGLALQFAEEKDDGSLIFDVDTQEGMIVINEKPVVPLPK